VIKPVADELGPGGGVLGVSVKLEAEAAQLDPAERGELLQGLGLGEGALPRVARAAYHLLGRRTFLTTGDKESRAWTFRAGAKAPECAGVIHSDLQRGFIRAEVIHWDELLRLGSWHAAKDAGKLRVEGKDYEVVDGDVLEIRFNVCPMAWSLRAGEVLAPVGVMTSFGDRPRGALGRAPLDGALLLRPARSVPTVGM